MLTPPLIIDTFYERPSYAEWNIALTTVFFGLIFIGLAIELYRYLLSRKSGKAYEMSSKENQEMMLQST